MMAGICGFTSVSRVGAPKARKTVAGQDCVGPSPSRMRSAGKAVFIIFWCVHDLKNANAPRGMQSKIAEKFPLDQP